jgi:hypothetical protein
MRISTVIALLLSACSVAAADKPNLSGTWRVQQDAQLVDGVLPAITIVQNESDLHLSDASSKKNNSSVIDCNTIGKQCEATLDGHPVKVSYWFNGPVLVEMLYLGKDNERVVKTRRSLSDDGQKMTVEMIQIVPPGKSPVKAVFVREQHVASGQ